MEKQNIFKTKNIPQFWVVCVMFIYGLLLAEFANTLNSKMYPEQLNSMYSIFMKFTYVVVIVMAFGIWVISSFLFHLFAVLFNGDGKFGEFLKFTGLSYAIPAIFLMILIFMAESVEISQNDISNIFKTNQTMRNISLFSNIIGFGYYLLLIPIIKTFYRISWLRAIGAIIIPFGSIYLLGQFFSNYVL
jgi:hypothetical protein